MFLLLSPNLLRVPHIPLLWLLNPLLDPGRRLGKECRCDSIWCLLPGYWEGLCVHATPLPLHCRALQDQVCNTRNIWAILLISHPNPSQLWLHFGASLTCSSAIETALDSCFQSLDMLSVAFSNSLSLTGISSSLWGRMYPHYIQYTVSQGRWAVEMLVQVHCSPC